MLTLLFSAIALTASAAAAPPSAKADTWLPVGFDQRSKEKWRKDSPAAIARVKLDMNGDGLKGEAMLLTDPLRHRSALRIRVASKNTHARCIC